MPAAADSVYFDEDYDATSKYLEISEGDSLTFVKLFMSSTSAAKHTYIKMTGGSVLATSGIDMGYFHFYDNSFVAARFEQLGGTVVSNDYWRVGYRTGYSEWLLRGGTVTCNRVLFQTTVPATAANYSRIIIENGSFSVRGNVKATMESFFGTVIVPYNGEGELSATYDPTARGGVGETVVSRTARAGNPTPASGAVNAVSDQTLSWTAGPGSVSSNLYFGTEHQAVVEAEPTSAEFITNTTSGQYQLNDLEYGKTYYWRVDAVAVDSSVLRGYTWTFTVSNNITIDDFQSYADTAALQSVWAGAATLDMGSIYNSTKAMRLFFEHTNAAQKTSVTRTFSPALDWDEPGIMALALNCYGDANEISTLFVRVGDGSGNAVITYPNPSELYKDFNQYYRTWNIDLADISGAAVNLSAVTSMEIGFEGVGRGAVMFDDIKLYVARCVPAFFPGDITGDCNADITDLNIYARDWLAASSDVAASSLQSSPVLHYAFDEQSGYIVSDSSSNGFDGTTTDFYGHWLPSQGVSGGCLNLDGASGVVVPIAVFNQIDTEMTIAFWIYGDPAEYPGRYDFPFVATHNNGDRLMVNIPYKDGDVYWRSHLNPGPVNTAVWYDSVPSDWRGQWVHYAFTKNTQSGVMAIYRNGEMVRQTYGNMLKIANVAPVTNCFIGCLTASGTYAHKGKMDEFMMFNVELSQQEILTLANQTQMTQSSLSPADVNDDGVVNMGDFSMMAGQWLNEQTKWPF